MTDRSTALAVATPNNLSDLKSIASAVSKSGLYGMKVAEEAFVIMLTGMELGLSPMQSLRAIHCWGGKPVLSADLMVALVRQSLRCEYFEVDEITATQATYKTLKADSDVVVRRTFSLEDAKKAGLLGKDNWKHYPKDMLRARAASKLARQEYPEVCLGLYTQDEIEDTVIVTDAVIVELVEPTPDLISEGRAKQQLLDTVTEMTGLAEMDAADRARRIWEEAALSLPYTVDEVDALCASVHDVGQAPASDSEADPPAEEAPPKGAGAARMPGAAVWSGETEDIPVGRSERSSAIPPAVDICAICFDPLEQGAHGEGVCKAPLNDAAKAAMIARAEAWVFVETLINDSGASEDHKRAAIAWLGTKGEVGIAEWTQALKEADDPASLVDDMAHKWEPSQ